MSKHCEHLILIGDHVQLRPNPTVYKLAKDYHIDVSLFERLINNNIKKEILTCQHRMRSEISILMRHFYDNSIKDHESVKKYPFVNGVEKNIYFIDHKNMEKKNKDDGTSKTNEFEAEYLANFCNYLVKQHYSETKITILSMYLGQLVEIRSLLRKKFKLDKVKVSTVDNYQGEENDIILLSLVRSNNEQKIGFLSIENRVCVALSRARHGLYVIGNISFLAEHSKIWNDLYKTVQSLGILGNLTLTCGKHHENDLQVKKPSDFMTRPEGGCTLPCDFRLKCGHNCRLLCHTYNHENYKCKSICNKLIPVCGHNCLKNCGHEKKCGIECSKMIEKIIPDCGHKVLAKCSSKTPERKQCQQQCQIQLKCGHKCEEKCFEIPCKPCSKLIEIDPICQHKNKIQVKCSDDAYLYQNACKKVCNQTLQCGHVCNGMCGKDCFSGYLHKKCQQKCIKKLPCGHRCAEKCADRCSPCQKECKNKCSHSKCQKKCGLECTRCMEKCEWQCNHKKCNLLCHEICDRGPCNEPCPLLLKCNHACFGFCGEQCPKICLICDKKIVIDSKFIVLVDCGHEFEKNVLDDWVKNCLELPECPKCKTLIQTTMRYNKYFKIKLNSINELKLRHIGHSISLKIEKRKLLDKIERLKNNKFNNIKKYIEKNELSINDCQLLTKKIVMFERIERIETKTSQFKNWRSALIKFEANKIKSNLFALNSLIDLQITSQQINDITNELNRFEKIIQFAIIEDFFIENYVKNDLCGKKSEADISKWLSLLQEVLLQKVNPYFKIEIKVTNYLKELYELIPILLKNQIDNLFEN